MSGWNRLAPDGKYHPANQRPAADLCSSCRVQKGVCPDCGTFWWVIGTKRYGSRLMMPDPTLNGATVDDYENLKYSRIGPQPRKENR